METIIDILKIFGPWAVALVSLIAFITNYRYSLKKDRENQKEVNNLKSAVSELNQQTNEIQLIRREAGIANEINARSVIGLREQIFELRRQTEQFVKTNEVQQKVSDTSYLPELFVSDIVFYIHSINYKGYPLPLIYSTNELQVDNEHRFLNGVTIKLLNIGFAPAKSINLKWEFDFNKALKKFEEVREKSIYEVVGSEMVLEISAPLAEYRHMNVVSTQLSERQINYLLPATIDNSPKEIEIPRAYLDLYSIFLSSAFSHFKKKEEDTTRVIPINIEDFPNLELELRCIDLQNKEHTKKFNLQFHVYSMISLKKDLAKINMPVGTIGIKIKEEKTLHTTLPS